MGRREETGETKASAENWHEVTSDAFHWSKKTWSSPRAREQGNRAPIIHQEKEKKSWEL